VDRAAARLARGEAGARDAVLAAHQRAVPALLARLLAPGSGAASRARLADALSRITGHVVPYDPAAAEAERRSALGQWRDFARAEDLTYRDLGRGERVAAAVTQTRFARWLGRLVRGDFGESLYFRQRAWDVVSARLPVTLGLNLAALLLAYALSLPLGLWSAVRAGRPAERAVTAALFALYALPTYWVALLAVRFLGGIDGPGLFPTSGLHSERPADLPGGSVLLDQLWHAVLPVLCLTYASLAQLTAQARASLVDVLRRDHIRTARAKGLPESTVLWRHAVPGGVLPLVGLLGAQVPYLLSGSVIVETVFDLPGLGSLMLLAIQQRDVNVLMAVVTLTAGLTWLGLLLADLLLLAVDPRIRLEPGRPR
jgi:peptide/nickel transport system permease protein